MLKYSIFILKNKSVNKEINDLTLDIMEKSCLIERLTCKKDKSKSGIWMDDDCIHSVY